MGLERSTFYDAPSVAVDDTEIVRRMRAICDEYETYGYRRVGAALRQDRSPNLVGGPARTARLTDRRWRQRRTPRTAAAHSPPTSGDAARRGHRGGLGGWYHRSIM